MYKAEKRLHLKALMAQPVVHKQVTLKTAYSRGSESKDLREQFVHDFVKMCTVLDIPIAKLVKIILPQMPTLREMYVPTVSVPYC